MSGRYSILFLALLTGLSVLVLGEHSVRAQSMRPKVTVHKAAPGKSREIIFENPRSRKSKGGHHEGTLTMRAPTDPVDRSRVHLAPGEHFGDKAPGHEKAVETTSDSVEDNSYTPGIPLRHYTR